MPSMNHWRAGAVGSPPISPPASSPRRAARRAGPLACLLVGALSTTLYAADPNVVPTRTSICVNSNAASMFGIATIAPITNSYGSVAITRFSFGSLVTGIVTVVADVTGELGTAFTPVWQTAVDQVTNIAGYVVTLSHTLTTAAQSNIKPMIDHRPEWFTNPPPWLSTVMNFYLGGVVTIAEVNNVTNLTVALSHNDFHLTDDIKSQIAQAVVNEAISAVEVVTVDAVDASVTPIAGVFIDAALAYGFDKVQDKADGAISQHYLPSGSGSQQVATMTTQNQKIQLDANNGTVATSILVANQILIGNAANVTLVCSNDGGVHPSYCYAIGGNVRLTGTVHLLGAVTLGAVPTPGALPQAVKDYANLIISHTPPPGGWIDNTLPGPPKTSG